MTSLLLLAALAVLPSDRMAMADRLFNRGDYARARTEYAALKGEATLAADELLYRLGECDRMLGKGVDARQHFGELLEKYPTSKHADNARLMRAMAGTEAEQKVELRALDSDRVAGPIRATALYRLGTLLQDADCLARAVKADPKGRYAAFANFHRAAILSKSTDPKVRREAVSTLLTIAFGKDSTLAEEALYLASVQSYGDRRYGEAATLFHRYMKGYPQGKHAVEARKMAAWSDYLAGKYADVLAVCGEGSTDDLAYLRAAATQASGESEAAVRLFRKYLEDYPEGKYRDSAELPLARLGFAVAEKEGNDAGLLENAQRAYRLSKSASDGLRLAWAYEKAGKGAEAAAQYAAVAKASPKTAEGAEALYRMALIDLRAEKWSPAELSLAEALASGQLGRRKASALYWRGVAALRLDHEAEAAGFLNEALSAGLSLDEAREARLILADFALKEGKTDEAKAAYAKLVAEGACDRMSAAKTLQVGKLLDGEAAKACARALVKSASPEWRQAGFALLGAQEEKAQSYAAAIDAYRQAAREKATVEDLALAVLRLGVLESRAGEWDAAEATLKRAVELNAADARARAEAYLALATNCVGKKDFKGARGYATVVTSLFDDKAICGEAEKILAAYPEEAK